MTIPRLLRPLSDRAMALLWGGMALSAIGDQIYIVAMSWIAIEAFGPAAGWLVALGPLAQLLTVLFAGAVADRWAPLAAMVGADAVRGAVLVLAVLAWSVMGAPSPAALAVAVIVLGAGLAVFRPALQVVVPALVPDRAGLPAANALLDATERLARLAGPALAGLLSGLLPIRHLLTLDALSFGASACALLLIGRHRPVGKPAIPSPGGVIASINQGVRAMRRHPVLGYVLATTGVLNGVWYVAFFLALPLAIAGHGLVGPGGTGLGAFGLVISAYGCTNLAANLVIGNRDMTARPGRQIFIGNLCLGVGIAMIALADALLPTSWLLPGYMAGALLSAVGGPMQDIPVAVLRQTALPAQDVPAAMRAYIAVNQTGLLAGLAITPVLLAAIPVWAVILLCGAVILGIGVVGLRRVWSGE